MHQRSTAPRSRRWVGGILSLLLISGCFPTPTKAPSGSKATGTLVAGKPVASSSDAPPPADAPVQQPSVPTLPIEVKAPIISHNGGNVIQGTVMAPAKIISHNGGNIVGNNGGNIISHNGGNVVSNGGGNIISHNGGNLKISQVPLANAVVRLKDAAGKPVKDDKGNELVTKTDENGGYKFPVDVKGRNLVVHAEVPGQTSDLVALLPKEGVVAGTSVAVDMASTLTLSYILELYVKGDLATFEKLPKDLESKARVQTEEAIVKGAIAIPETLVREELISTVSDVLKADANARAAFEEIRKLLVVIGVQGDGNGLPATDIPVSTIDGTLADSNGTFYVFSRSRHAIWKVENDGRASTICGQGQWGYDDIENDKLGDFTVSGMDYDLDGTIIVADTNYNRIVRVSKDRRVSTIAGTGTAGYSGDGGKASLAQLNRPTGLAVLADGTILFSDSSNNRIRQISRDGNIYAFAGGGTAPSSSSSTLSAASFSRPQGLIALENGNLLVADYGNDLVRIVSKELVTPFASGKKFIGPVNFTKYRNEVLLICPGERGVYSISGDVRAIDTKRISQDIGVPVYNFDQLKIILAVDSGLIFNDGGRLYLTHDLATMKHVFGVRSDQFSAQGQLSLAYGLAIVGESVFVSDMGRHIVYKLDNVGQLTKFAGNGDNSVYTQSSDSPTTMPLPFPHGLSSTADGGLLICSVGSFPVVRKFFSTGTLRTIAGNGTFSHTIPSSVIATNTGLSNPYEAIELPSGQIVVSEPENNRLSSLDAEGIISKMFDGIDLKFPRSLCLDAQGRINFIEFRGDRVVQIDEGQLETRITFSSLNPEIPLGETIRSIAFDSENNLFVATKSAVVRVEPNGRKTPIAGIGTSILNGNGKDDGLSEIERIAISKSGHLYVLETTQLKKIPADLIKSL